MTNRRSQRFMVVAITVLTAGSLWLLGSAADAQIYVPPTTPFTNDSPVAPPINSSSTIQQKLGSLGVGSPTNQRKICLNASNVGDTTNCISSWNDLAGQFGGPFVVLSHDQFSLRDPSTYCGPNVPKVLCTGDYTSQQGYAHEQAQGQQGFSTVVQADFGICDGANRLGLSQGDQGQPGKCSDGPKAGNDCYVNSDCGFDATAVYANAGTAPASTAGYFSGVLLVTPALNDPLSPEGRICLNGSVESPINDTPGGVCISTWSEIASTSTPPYVKRQFGSTLAPQGQGAAISGVLATGSATVGDPNGVTTTFSCGDGFCSSAESTAGTCPIDCDTIHPLKNFSASLGGTIVSLNFRASQQLPSGGNPVRVTIIRSTNDPSTFQPLNGVVYTAGQVFGADTVIYSALVTPNTFLVAQDVLPYAFPAGTYSYRAFQGNAYPRYGATSDASIGQIYRVTTRETLIYAELDSQDGFFSCLSNQASGSGCYNFYPRGAVVTLFPTNILFGHNLTGWSGCDSVNGLQCTVTATSNKDTVANMR